MANALDDYQIQEFIQNGFIRINDAFSQELAEEGRAILWADTGCDPANSATWTQPVIRLGGYAQAPFRLAANTSKLVSAYDQLVGVGRWVACTGLGTFPVRFPSPDDTGDTGWHAEASFAGPDGSWRLNVNSKGRALLMLFLFSDVDILDAPTRILVGSHLDVPKLLEPAGEAGLSFIELSEKFGSSLGRPISLAVGKAGTVYLCHPFLIHAAQHHQGKNPRFMAQPPLYPSEPLQLTRVDGNYSPVEQAIRLGLQ